MTINRNRQPSGIPAGGEFAPHQHAGPALALPPEPPVAGNRRGPAEAVDAADLALQDASGGVVSISKMSYGLPPGAVAVAFNCEHDLELFIQDDGKDRWGWVAHDPRDTSGRKALAEVLTPQTILNMASEHEDYPYDLWEEDAETHKAGMDIVKILNELLDATD